jgi:hypothetical protein
VLDAAERLLFNCQSSVIRPIAVLGGQST